MKRNNVGRKLFLLTEFFIFLTQGIPVAISPEPTMALFENKIEFGRFVSRNISFDLIPQMYTSIRDIRYPCVVKLLTKGYRGVNGNGVHFVYNKTILENLFQKNKLSSNFDSRSVLVQEAVETIQEYSYFFVAYHGKILPGLENQLCKVYFHVASQIQSYSKNENSTLLSCTSIPHWPVVDQFIKTMSMQWRFNGLGCVDFKLNSTSYPKIFEINPRLCGTIARQRITMASQLNAWWNERERSIQSI